MDEEQPSLSVVGGRAGHEALETALFEIKRVIAGQDEMLERVLVCLLSGGHLLIEGVPGLAKTLTIKTTAAVLGGTFNRVQFTPDLVPADLVGTRIYRPGQERFDVELGPVFCNFLLADEINRAPAKVQSALLEVMQERQVTIGHDTHLVPDPFLAMATQNPIESEGTYPLPEAQVDRFLMKLLVDYPSVDEETAIIDRSVGAPPATEVRVSSADLERFRTVARNVFVDRAVVRYAAELGAATRFPGRYGLERLEEVVQYGSSPRGPIALVHSAQALALLRGRQHVVVDDLRHLAGDVLRHRITLSYDAAAEGVDPDSVVAAVLDAVHPPAYEVLSSPAAIAA